MATDIIARGMITEYKSGTNISFKENEDGSVTISASGDISSEDLVARETIDNHKLDKNNPHNVTAEQVGLGNVDNTADLDKPISTAVQTALDKKVNKTDVQDNLESTDTTSPLSANQGKILNEKIVEHTDNSDIHVTVNDKENWNSHINDVTSTGNPVVMDGLQGGVPFSEIVVSGKNLIPYPYNITSGVYNGLTVDISDDGKFSINGTATADTTLFEFAKQSNPIYLSGGVSYTLNCSQQYNIDSFNLFFKNYHADKTYSGYTKYPASFTAKNGDYLVGSLWIKSGSVVNAENVEIQLELGDTATEYEPPITGRELTVGVCGKNLLKYPYVQTTLTSYGITFTDNGDGSITASGTHDGRTEPAYFGFSPWWANPNGGRLFLPKGNTVTFRVMGLPNTYRCMMAVKKDNTSADAITAIYGVGESVANYTAEQDCYIACGIYGLNSSVGQAVNFTAYPQLELGDTATAYEPYHGATYTITPDSNPYTIPDDIRQQDGINNVSISAGKISVTGVKKSPVINRAWKELDNKADLTDIPTTLPANGGNAATVNGYTVNANIPAGFSPNNMMSKTNPTGTGSFSLNRKADTTIGDYSFAEGSKATASGDFSHAEGADTTASGRFSHAEGESTIASADDSHAEGQGTTASGERSHAEGQGARASGESSHAEGQGTTASGESSHAEGAYTTAENYASHASGKYNATMTAGGSSSNTTGTAFVIGNGTSRSALSNAFSVQYDGTVKAKSTITASTTADYAEFFEWLDENPDDEDRVGYFVTLDGDKIRIATTADDYILGVVSGEPFVLGNGDCDTWNGMYLHDEFRRTIYEPAPKMIEILDSEGNPTGEYEEVEGEFEGTRPKLNPEYDYTQPYISRLDRKEWAPVGMLGVLAVRHDGTAQVNGYVTVNADGIATACEKNAENAYRVIKSNTDSVVEIIFR